MPGASGAGGLVVDHGGLEVVTGQLRSTVRAIDGRMGHLDADLAPLRGDWAGSAQEAYTLAKATWDSAIAEMLALLDQTAAGVSAANADYRAADLRGAQSFQIGR